MPFVNAAQAVEVTSQTSAGSVALPAVSRDGDDPGARSRDHHTIFSGSCRASKMSDTKNQVVDDAIGRFWLRPSSDWFPMTVSFTGSRWPSPTFPPPTPVTVERGCRQVYSFSPNVVNPPHTGPMAPAPLKAPRLFKVLCVLTMLGNLFLIVVNLVKAGMLYAGIRSGGVGSDAAGPLKILMLVVILSCVGSVFGAALMLRGRRLGFYIYASSNVVHLLATACVMLIWLMTVYLSVVAVLLFFYSFIPLGFLLYFRSNRAWMH